MVEKQKLQSLKHKEEFTQKELEMTKESAIFNLSFLTSGYDFMMKLIVTFTILLMVS